MHFFSEYLGDFIKKGVFYIAHAQSDSIVEAKRGTEFQDWPPRLWEYLTMRHEVAGEGAGDSGHMGDMQDTAHGTSFLQASLSCPLQWGEESLDGSGLACY